MVSGVVHMTELIRHFLSLSAATTCSTSGLDNAKDLMLNLPLSCVCVKGKLCVDPVANSADFTQRSCLKTSYDYHQDFL